jgi:hypothetical protein
MNPLYTQLVRDALDALDRYRTPIGKRDPVKSLNEDGEELLQRMRAALEPRRSTTVLATERARPKMTAAPLALASARGESVPANRPSLVGSASSNLSCGMSLLVRRESIQARGILP